MPVKRGPNEVGSKRLFSDLQTDEPIAARTRSKLLEAAKRTVVWLTSVEDVRLPDLPDTLADSADPDARVVTVPANAKRKLLDALLSDVNTLYGAEDYHAPLFPTAGSGIVVLKASGLDTTVAVDWTGKFDTVATKMADCPERKAIEAIADVEVDIMDSNDQKIITSEAEEVKHEHERESDQMKKKAVNGDGSNKRQ